MRRRTLLSTTAITGLGLIAREAAEAQSAAGDSAGQVSVDWLGGMPPLASSGTSWGVPWPRGVYRKDQAFALTAGDGKALPLQTWPLAYWPDGSLKWSGFATVAGAGMAGPLRLAPGKPAAMAGGSAVTVREAAAGIDVDTGRLQCRIPRSGASIVDSLAVEGRVVARQGRLRCTLEDRTEPDTVRLQHFVSAVRKTTVEQTGPVRAVVRIEGVHKAEQGGRDWLPFIVRLYFYGGETAVRMIHTIVFDGDQEKDFIRGLGVTFAVPMREQVHNRHVRFSGEAEGLWAEPVEPAIGARRLTVPGGGDVYAGQLAGKRLPDKDQLNDQGRRLLENWAVWDSFKLAQLTADGFTVQKRTNPQSCWISAGAGRRASGLVFAGDVSGGLAVALRNFWQSYPASLEVSTTTREAAELSEWLWSPDAPAMDLRHSRTRR